ncbi:unnamed protein product [Adineta steineri]|uniref:Uncharacterized protein n=1 Tax=Adineta steineri TaxID=433720 RepID=A0A813SC76_9BILA|nr:unnamed protein product [Adineta steineri]CAF0794243.1 unnamed protein product [Adineta steineri]
MKTSDTIIGKNRCVTCDKEKATLRCGGCLQEFCFNHLTDHRQELRKQLDDIIATRDVFQQTLNEQRNDLEKHALIGKINEWERVSIKTIQQTAEEERQKVYKYASVHRRQIKFDPNKLSEQLGQSREENDIDDTNIRDWNEELNRLAKQLIKPLCIKLELDTTPLINAISVNVTPKPPAPSSNWNSNRGSSFGSRSSRGRSSGGFGSRNNDSGGSGFSGRGGRGGSGVGGGGFGSNNNVDSHRCYKCNQTGHMSRECQEPRKENRSDHSCFSSNGSRGGFDSDDSDDHNINFIPESNDGPASRSVNFGNSRNQNNSDSKPSFGNWRKSATSNSNDSEDVKNSSTFGKSESRGGFNRRGGFRGGRGGGGGGFSLGDRGGRGGDSGGGNSGKCYNCDQFGHQSRDCPEERKPREGGSSSFFSAGGGGDGAGRRSDRVSDDIFDQASGRANGQPTERYIPPPAPTSEDDIFGEAVSKGENFGKYHRTQIQCTPEGSTNENIIQIIEEVRLAEKKDRLFQLLKQNLKDERCLIFVETKRHAQYIAALLSQKELISTTMHGDLIQRQRTEAIQQFTNGKCPILVATSVAARRLDFPLISYVVNYDLPNSIDLYTHQIGHTDRLGKSISFFDPERDSDRTLAPELILKLTEAGQEVPDFLRQYSDTSNSGFGHDGYSERNTNVGYGATGFGSRNLTVADTEEWD